MTNGLMRTPGGNFEVIDVAAIGSDLERLAVERYALTLRERVRALPTNDDDGLWVRTQVIRMLEEVTTDRSGPGSPTAAASAPYSGPEQPAVADPGLGGHAVEVGSD